MLYDNFIQVFSLLMYGPEQIETAKRANDIRLE